MQGWDPVVGILYLNRARKARCGDDRKIIFLPDCVRSAWVSRHSDPDPVFPA